MSKKTESLTKNIASSRNWFRSEFLPDDIQFQHNSFSVPTALQCYDGIKMIYVEEGSGTIFTNGKMYPLQSGSCCLLYCFHFHKIIPALGCALKLCTCYISYNTFLFASIVPGYHLIEIEQSQIPILVNFSNPQQMRIRQILTALEDSQGTSDRDLQHALLFEWLGRLCRAYKLKDVSIP